jgi:hypothetical protein
LEKITLDLTLKILIISTTFFSAGTMLPGLWKLFLSYANTGNNGAPVPQEFVNTHPENQLAVCIRFLGTNLKQSIPATQWICCSEAMLGIKDLSQMQ